MNDPDGPGDLDADWAMLRENVTEIIGALIDPDASCLQAALAAARQA